MVEGAPSSGARTVFRVQVGAFADEDAARAELRRLEQKYGKQGVVRHDPDRGNWRVRLGGEKDRLELQALLDRLRGDGIEGWIAEESGTDRPVGTIRLVDARYESIDTGLQRLALVPDGGRVRVEGIAYRGIVELRVDRTGKIRPVNWIQLEQYLLGVVPAELGPAVWPEVEALKAQAVAARTYAWRHRGQFVEDGYDLCATPRCQAYKGADAEHPLSDRAVAATSGEILLHDEKPITAYYTATCGGHTENVENVFIGEKEPYLVGVECRAEAEALATQRGTVRGRKATPIVDESGDDVTLMWARLNAAGVLPGASGGDGARRALTTGDLKQWTSSLRKAAGRPEDRSEPGPVGTLGQAALSTLRAVGWADRAEVLLDTRDLPALLRDDAALELPEDQRRALGYLASQDAIRPRADGRFGVGDAPSRARLFRTLHRVAEAYNVFRFRDTVVTRVTDRHLTLVQGNGKIKLALGSEPLLFGRAGGKQIPVDTLTLWPGDRVRVRTGSDGRIDLIELRPPVKGTSDDRSAKVYSWEMRRTRRQLERTINRRVSIGRLKDLRILERGVSGRAAKLEVIGTKGTATVEGFDGRRLLDLRESLVVAEVQRDRSGEIEAVVFAGKGWGHGVGLCQVGAYGMALRGKSYREILAHYYRGATLSRSAR